MIHRSQVLSTSTLRAAVALLTTAGLSTAQWAQVTTTNQPTPRRSAAMEFVPQNAALVLFGGAAPLNNDQTWTFDGTNWTQLTPATSPTARFGAELVYDAVRGVAVLYGGLASNISVPPPNDDTWEWDGTNWAMATPAANPGPRYLYGACYDLLRGRVVMYGGASSQGLTPPNNQTWEYDGTNWTQITTSGNPGPRERPAMCFHTGIGKTVMFGGGNGSAVTDQTWLYDGQTATWSQVATTGAHPSARNAARISYDYVHQICVLVGGQDSSGILSDTWAFDGASWKQQATPPQTVRDHAMAFLPVTSQVIRFGGFVAAPNTLTNETWQFGTGTYGTGCAGSNGAPLLTAADAPRLGQSWTLNVANLNPNFNLAFLVLGAAKAPGIDLGFLGMPTCAAYTFPDVLIAVTGAAGTLSWTWPVVAGPVGATFYSEALCLDPPANSFGFTTSNGLYATLVD
ncbi:MAG TPA: hypothetical protein VFZ65_05800 [Planctomycetota bacterium]|nr:hypothetical protein [Planctomycetota bacterium]